MKTKKKMENKHHENYFQLKIDVCVALLLIIAIATVISTLYFVL